MTRGQAYRQTGWSQFDQNAQPYTTEQIDRERRLYGEGRSFAGDDLSGSREEGLGGDDDRYRTDPPPGLGRGI
jgi:hypothetical protein